ncbi:SPRY domain-containing SOCS box protein 4 [Homalodisca vitripennis]|nr:SPRY domain-containing SOCS box protein 4 [Homalodisca vitripennis]
MIVHFHIAFRVMRGIQSLYAIILNDVDEEETARPLQLDYLRRRTSTFPSEDFMEAFMYGRWTGLQKTVAVTLSLQSWRGNKRRPVVSDETKDGEDSQYRSWGWDLVTIKLFEGDKCYPLQQNEEWYTVPDKFDVVLHMMDGTLSFIVNGKWLGTVLSGMAGHCLYTIVSSRQCNCRIRRWLRW